MAEDGGNGTATALSSDRAEEIDVKPSATTIQVRCPAELLIKLDGWRRAQPDAPTRAIAVRRLTEQALAGTDNRQHSSASKRKAADMAGTELDRLGDQQASGEERAHRKRHLIRGPQEFRNMRRDQPKKKRPNTRRE